LKLTSNRGPQDGISMHSKQQLQSCALPAELRRVDDNLILIKYNNLSFVAPCDRTIKS
jgi:hypothetical protein